MRRKLLQVIGLILFLAQIFSGCIPSKPSESVEILPSERLIKKLEANRRKIKNFEGTGTIKITTSEMNNTASFRVIILKPDSIYINIYGPFGIDLASALVTSDNFIFYDDIHNVVYKGKSDNEILKKIFKIDITFGELEDMFAGSVNLTSELSREPDNYEIAYDKYILTYTQQGSERKSRYFIDIRELSIINYQLLDPSGNVLVEGDFSKFKIIDELSIPYAIRIHNKEEDQMVNIDYRKIEINKSSIKIHLEIPEDAEVVQL